MCKILNTFIAGEKIFKVLDLFMNEKEIPLKKYIDICTNRAKSMTGPIKGVVLRIKKENLKFSFSHCAIYRHQLIPKRMPFDCSNVLNDWINIVNFLSQNR